jgi:hypothetical protein
VGVFSSSSVQPMALRINGHIISISPTAVNAQDGQNENGYGAGAKFAGFRVGKHGTRLLFALDASALLHAFIQDLRGVLGNAMSGKIPAASPDAIQRQRSRRRQEPR